MKCQNIVAGLLLLLILGSALMITRDVELLNTFKGYVGNSDYAVETGVMAAMEYKKNESQVQSQPESIQVQSTEISPAVPNIRAALKEDLLRGNYVLQGNTDRQALIDIITTQARTIQFENIFDNNNTKATQACTPNQLVNGSWVGSKWRVNDESCYAKYFDSEMTNQCLHDSSVVFIGDSVTRHLFLSLIGLVRNAMDIGDGMNPGLNSITENVPKRYRASTNNRLDKLHREFEKTICTKAVNASKYGSVNSKCYGFCSCHFVAGKNVSFTFYFSTRWYDETTIRKQYDQVFATNNNIKLLTVNAGLHPLYNYGYSRTSKMVQAEVPKLMEIAQMFESKYNSKLVYRKSTKSCDDANNEQLRKVDMLLDSEYYKHEFRDSMVTLNFWSSTNERNFYLDCNHPTGPHAILHNQILLNTVCG